MLREEPNDSFLNYAMALELEKKGEFKKAISLIEELLSRDENYLGAYYQLGKYYEEDKNISGAKTIYQKGITIAQKQKNRKAEGELKEALLQLED